MSTTSTTDTKGASNGVVRRDRPSVLSSLLCGAVAGCIAKTTIAPLDRTKIYFQVSSTRGYSFRSAIKFVVLTYREHGFFALFRGNSATMTRVMPYAAIQFAAFEQYRHWLQVDVNNTRTPGRRCIVGSMAGATAVFLTYPLDTAKARLSISTKKEYGTLASSKSLKTIILRTYIHHTQKYTTCDEYGRLQSCPVVLRMGTTGSVLGPVFVKTVNEGGALALYRGLWPTLLGVTPYAGASFFTYETLKLKYKEQTGRDTTSPWRMLFGAFAGLVGQSSSYPLDIVRRRMQTGHINPGDGVFRSLVTIYRNEGLKRGLYKGLSMNWVKGPIAVGVSFTTYEYLRQYFLS